MKMYRRIILTAIGCGVLLLSIHIGRETVLNIQAIKNGLDFYSPTILDTVQIDDALLIQLIQRSNIAHQIPLRTDIFSIPYVERFSRDPLKRILSPDEAILPITFTERIDRQQSQQNSNNNSYHINPPFDQYLRDPYDDILLRALYCDQSVYTDADYILLRSLRHRTGDYSDTHFLLGLLLLRENGCFDDQRLTQEIRATAADIARAEAKNQVFSDLSAERIVFLYWAGFGNLVERKWIERVRMALTDDPGWRDNDQTFSNAHTTGLALLALIYFEEGKKQQIFYFPHRSKTPQ